MLDKAQLQGLDVDRLRAEVEAVLSDELYWFPVRHHSPAVSRHLRSAIRDRKPEVIFVEGPSHADDLVPYVVDPKTRPPVAIYSSYRDDDNVLGLAGIASPAKEVPARFATWYPLLNYSPEYVAMKAAADVGAEVVLMDLPHHALIRPVLSDSEEDSTGPLEDSDSEKLLTASSFYQALAESAGYRSWDQAWDSLFEFGTYGEDRETFRRELATFCAAARATADRERVFQDGTLHRERFMWRTIRDTLERTKVEPGRAMVVCGGFHLFLDRKDDTPPPEPPAGTVYTAVMPYSFFRISELSGYAAGNRAPRFYQTVWDLDSRDDLESLLSHHVVAIVKRARREGEAVSSADAISVAQHARMLASLRGRPVPILDDIHDAVMTCCCKGDPALEGRFLHRAIDAIDIGTKIGAVTPTTRRLPLLNDFYIQLDDLGLEEVVGREKRMTVKLDKRETAERNRSTFLHRLRFLEIPLCNLVEGEVKDLSTGTLFREGWRLAWSPEVEPELVERNLYGDTVESAALARLKENLAGLVREAGATCRVLREAVDMDLPALVTEIEPVCESAIANDTRFPSLSEAVHELQVLHRYAVYQNLRRDILEKLIEQAFERACFALPESANAPEEDQENVIDALRVVAEALLGDEEDRLERDLFVQHVQTAAEVSNVSFLRGAFLGMLTELRVLSPEDSSAMLAAFAKEPPERMVEAGDFLDGMLATCRTSVFLGADHLVAAIDELVKAAEWEAFLVMLPRLRAAFERLHDRQRDSLADRVARRYGLKEMEDLTELRTSVGAAALFAEIDREVARILEIWDL
jgi:hypothetical protein